MKKNGLQEKQDVVPELGIAPRSGPALLQHLLWQQSGTACTADDFSRLFEVHQSDPRSRSVTSSRLFLFCISCMRKAQALDAERGNALSCAGARELHQDRLPEEHNLCPLTLPDQGRWSCFPSEFPARILK